MELEHFSHDHPLILRTDYMEEGVKVHCYGCRQPISELPREMTYHPSHPDHPLTLLPKPPYRCTCDVCREECDRFVYNCCHCNFDVNIRCASVVSNIQQRIELQCHPHQLIPLEKSATFLCDACGEEHGGTSYLCTTCGFWVSQKCANSLPSTIKLGDHHHPHPLTLIYSIPYERKCRICTEPLYRRNWLYHCADSKCKYSVHVNCAASKKEHSKHVF
ncbi:hypothetical protein LOK49_LG15G00569 [Camellia lanceoleosa]|uniref:Uncharacterized protein n=1 Tax=Camellia lanceoleosa TaxID=1840588 RepID=A0ACC0F0L3_9ERIC|nr:hypothetical protein LOK49_LG15G00569 [Camellia lanceoleosa]